jgi:hypothetical protein
MAFALVGHSVDLIPGTNICIPAHMLPLCNARDPHARVLGFIELLIPQEEAKKWKEGRIVMNMIIMCQGNKLGRKENLRREERTGTQYE